MYRQSHYQRKIDRLQQQNSLFGPEPSVQQEQSRSNSHKGYNHNFTVAVRIKPKQLHQDNVKIILNKNNKEMSIQTTKQTRNNYYGGKCKTFKMDAIYEEKVSNNTIFSRTVKEKLSSLKSNRNVALMAYGATNSGKTYTILGSNKASKHDGLVHISYRYLMEDLFQGSFKFYFSYLEIYNENIQDLLCQHQRRHNLNVFQDHSGKINIPELTRIQVSTYQEICQLIEHGSITRAESSNNINKLSSRSHAILQLQIFSVQEGDSEVTQTPIDANFMIIDLAGSEKSTPYFQQTQQLTLKQGSNINRSLLALGNCIKNLANGDSHIPYRNSKLTRLLKENLSGSCHNIMIACISHATLQFEESINTLQYASKACRIEIAENTVNGRDRGKFVTIPCEHCKMSIDFNYISKSLKHHAFQVVDQLGEAKIPTKINKQSQQSSNEQKILENIVNRIKKFCRQPQKMDYLHKILQNIQNANPKIEINIQETQDSQKQKQNNEHQISFLKLKTKLNLHVDRGTQKLVIKNTNNDDKNRQRQSRSRSQKSVKLRLKQKHQKQASRQQIQKQSSSLYIKIQQQPKSLNTSSINSRRQDNKIINHPFQQIRPFLPQLSFDISDFYQGKQKRMQEKMQNDFSGVLFSKQKRNSEPKGSSLNKQNSQMLANCKQMGSMTQRQPNSEEFEHFTRKNSAQIKILRRMKQDVLCLGKQLSKEMIQQGFKYPSEGEAKSKIKLISRVR